METTKDWSTTRSRAGYLHRFTLAGLNRAADYFLESVR